MPALASFLRHWPEQPTEAALQFSAQPAALVDAAARHGLSGLVQHALAKDGAALPPDVAGRLASEALHGRALSMQVRRLLAQSLDALAAAGITPVVLKGVPLAERLYGDAGHRACRDVDLWVHPNQSARAEAALTSLGLSPASDNEPHHRALSGPAGLVELHAFPAAPFGRKFKGLPLWQRATHATIDGWAYLHLAPDDELLYLAIHATNHLMQRLTWLYDLKLLIRSEPALDWDRLVMTASQARVASLAFYALDAARRVLGADVPPDALESLRPSAWRAAAASRAFSEERLEATYFTAHKAAWVSAKVALAPSYSALLSLAWRRLRSR